MLSTEWIIKGRTYPRTENMITLYQKNGIKVIACSYADDISLNVLPVTSCGKCKPKTIESSYLPKELYLGKTQQLFMEVCQEIDYAIVSDLYGLHFCNVKKAIYDIHPTLLTVSERIILAKKIKFQALEKNYTSILYYLPSPIRAFTYLDILLRTGLEIIYTSNLKKFKPII